MTIHAWFDVFCDAPSPSDGGTCSEWAEGGGTRTAAAFRARDKGWRRVRANGWRWLWLCPAHVAEAAR